MTEFVFRRPEGRVSRRAILYWTMRALPPWLILIALQVVFLVGTSEDLRLVREAVLGGTIVLALAHLIIMPQWRFRVHRWESTPVAVYTQAGWFTVERRIAPVSRIQTVDSHIGPFERLFRLTNVTVTTASAAGPLKIHGLDRTEARTLVEDLIRTTQANVGDAT